MSSNLNPISFALFSCSKWSLIGIKIPGVPYTIDSSIVDFPASEITKSEAKIIS